MKTKHILFFIFMMPLLIVSQEIPQVTDIKSMTFIPDYFFTGSTLNKWKGLGTGKWSAQNGTITGMVQQENKSGILIFNEAFQDVAFQVSIKRNSKVETGLLFRFQENNKGFEAVLLSVDGEGTLVPFNVYFDEQGNETSREQLAQAGGIWYRVAPALKESARQYKSEKISKAPLVPIDLPVKMPNTDFVNGEWNQLEVYLDVNVIRSFLNDGREVGGTTGEEKNEDGFGPVALYIHGKGESQFKNILIKDISIKETPIENISGRFRVQRISDMYYSWGANAADFNRDGFLDVVAGPYIYYGPDYTKRREIFPAVASSPSLEIPYSKVQDTYDINHDGWPDVLGSAFKTTLYINPKGESRRWKSYNVLPEGIRQNEITVFEDIDQDGTPELVYGAGGFLRYAKPDKDDPSKPWTEFTVSQKGYATAHGIGTGDINGDGRIDILNAFGWWEQPMELNFTQPWDYHPVAFGRYGKRSTNIGSSIMAVYDVNGNGLNDVVANLNAHGFGLAWYEQKRDKKGEISFIRHMINDDYQFNNKGGVTFSQPHGAAFADIDNDGIKDFIVGKRYFGHLDNYYDPDPYSDPVLYWYRTVRNPAAPGGAELVPELIHNRSGAGSEVTVVDLDNNGTLDIITSTTNGTYIFWNNGGNKEH
ncbi:FG-GAP-like repeat-containing protein [Arenibacter echinorum]|uniref:VCBS repeat protein n=1 Tax=Arenibacter echinorum TaxID=440515 RepID=A0A327R8M5_9FLAO|nr:FG-GAP-like repeat-containing protein [Arenibacter echinorum]RAJ10257.1 VCBS repeat protein [Arenibacter echinorum]